MRWTSKTLFAGLLGLSGLASCQGGEQSYDPNFVTLYTELRLATQEFGPSTEDAKRTRLQILKRHGYTLSRYDSTIQILEKHPDLWRRFQQDLMDNLDSLQPKLEPSKPVPKTPHTLPAKKNK